MKVSAAQNKRIRTVVAEFEPDGTTDYRRMEAAVYEATGLRLDNASVWHLINRMKHSVDRVSFRLED